MKNYDPITFNRQKWSDNKNTKNKPVSCTKDHTFCNFDYQWAQETDKAKAINLPINPSLTNVDLPQPAQKVIRINYDTTTQQNLDDWIAQSMNRSLGSILNPQKKYFIPPTLDQELRIRYRKNKTLKKIGNDDQTYFPSNRANNKKKGYLSNQRKKKLAADQLCFDFHKLEPKHEIPGTLIKVRQIKKVKKKQIIRRNAVLLNNDVHYARLLKQMQAHQKGSTHHQAVTEKKQVPRIMNNMIYSYNLESMNRKDCYEDVPNSIIQKQFSRIQAPPHDFLTSQRALMNQQEQLNEKYRLLMNQKTDNAINTIKQLSNNNQTQSKPSNKSQIPTHALTNLTKRKTQATKQTIQTSQPQHNKTISLQQKIAKMLNNMQVQSQNIDETMSKLNIHPQKIFLQHPDNRPQIKWILKAQQKIEMKQNQLAIDCYKQALIIQPEMFIAVFNIAVLLEKEKMLDSSAKWFNIAQEFQTDSENVAFGIAIVKLKQLKFRDALANITQLIKKLEANNRKIPLAYTYIKALCNKEIENYQEAKKDYNDISKLTKPVNYNILPDFIFSIVYSKIRRISLAFNCLSYMLFKEAIYLIEYQFPKKIKDQHTKLEDISEKLMTEPFFKRFSLKLVKKLLTMATYEQKQKDQILFCEKSKTSIILNGLVSLKSHEKDITKPNIISVLGKGGIIGGGALQNHISTKPNSWFSALSPVQLITVPRAQFEAFWKGQITFQLDFKANFLKNVRLFRGLSEMTILKLCEVFKLVTYQRGTILFNDCSYRTQLINKSGKGHGLAKPTKKTDPRFLQSSTKPLSKQQPKTKTRGRAKINALLKKHIFKFNQMKFSRLKYPGLFIVKSGSIQLEDDKGFRCSDVITSSQFFGENLVIDSQGFHNYGRMVVQSETAQLYFLPLDDLLWLFNQQDKIKMSKNCEKRQAVETICFLRNRFSQCLLSKFKCKRSVW